jgi:murein DD-endopeptidase MepM/ murein hydrolase activator NlpD
MKKITEKVMRFLKKNGAICAAGACALMVGTVFVVSNTNNTVPESTTPVSVPVQNVVVRPTPAATTTTTARTMAATTIQTVMQTKPEAMCWPAEGFIQTEFAQDKLIYRPTLKEWSVHPAVDIQAAAGTAVRAVMKGRVESVRDDRMLGKQVTLLHADGWRSLYASLDTVEVVVGDTVEAGDPLGTIGNSALEEISQGPHLHFVLEKDGKPVDPTEQIQNP